MACCGQSRSVDRRTRVGTGLGWAELTSLADCRGLATEGAATPAPEQARLQRLVGPCWAILAG